MSALDAPRTTRAPLGYLHPRSQLAGSAILRTPFPRLQVSTIPELKSARGGSFYESLARFRMRLDPERAIVHQIRRVLQRMACKYGET